MEQCRSYRFVVPSQKIQELVTTDFFTGVPHRAMEDSVIRGYNVPKGSIIIVNLWYVVPDHRP